MQANIDLDFRATSRSGVAGGTITFVDSHRGRLIVYKEKNSYGSTCRKFTPEFKAEA